MHLRWGFFLQASCFFTVSLVLLWMRYTQTNHPTFIKAEVEMHVPKKSPHFWWEGVTQQLFNIVKDLDINRYLDMHRYHKAHFSRR